MKKSIAALFAAGLCLHGVAESVKLPEPDLDGGLTVMQALKARHSEREFADTELTLQELSGVLWAANGFNRPDKRTNATGMNKQTIVLYVCMKSGAYRYDAKANELVKVSGEDLRPAVAGRQEFAATAPVSVVIAADTGDPIYKGDWSTLSCYDAGIVSGNIYLYCAAHNLATVCRGTMDREKLKKGLGLSDNMTLHLNHPVGHFAGAAASAPATDLRSLARARAERDVNEYGRDGMREIERLYRAYSAGGEGSESSLSTLLEKYPKANRTGCAVMYAAQRATGEERVKLLKRAIADHGDCIYGDGAQVGAYARMYLAGELSRAGDAAGAEKLYGEIRTLFPNARTHKGRPIADILPAAK